MNEQNPNEICSSKTILNHFRRTRTNCLYSEPIWKCFISNGNNCQLIETIVKSIGYERQIDDLDDFKLKWVQTIQNINWNLFKDKEQIVNHIQGEDYFTTKMQLYQSLQTYEKICLTMSKRPSHFLSLNQFVPQTFKLDEKTDRDVFFETHQPGDLWICKPSELNQGKGIYLVRDLQELKQQFHETNIEEKQRKSSTINSMKRIIQRYLLNPLLIDGKKFDIRCYMLITNVNPLLVFYHSGYLRLSMFQFDQHDQNLLTHLTNQYVQKKDPKYKQMKEETSWTMEQFNDYLNEQNQFTDLQPNWVLNILPKLIERILLNVIESIRMRLKRRVGCFGLYGCDLMIDKQMKVWLIEINVNPSLTTNTNTLLQVIPPVVKESILLAIECFEKLRHGQKVFPLKSLKGFQCIYNELQRKGSLLYRQGKRTRSTSPNCKSRLPRLSRSQTNKSFPNSSKPFHPPNDQSETKIFSKSVTTYSIRQTENEQQLFNSTNRQRIDKTRLYLQNGQSTQILDEQFDSTQKLYRPPPGSTILRQTTLPIINSNHDETRLNHRQTNNCSKQNNDHRIKSDKSPILTRRVSRRESISKDKQICRSYSASITNSIQSEHLFTEQQSPNSP